MKKILLFLSTSALILFIILAELFLSGATGGNDKLLGARMSKAAAAMSFDSIKTNLTDYIWPTDASTRITSTFAEYRTTHFHGGIDISTNGQTGYNVFSVRDGYVYRIRIFANDYGKMLYIRHRDGYVSTYAHLKGFNDEITRVVKEEQYRKGSYTIDLTLDPDRIPVTKGEVVAYTGESGVGPPHLHYELRDENLNPINPLLCPTYVMEDNIAPSILRIMIAPLSANSTVDNSISAKYFSRFPGARNHKRLPQSIHIQGEIGFCVDALDRANGTGTHSGIHRTEFYFDDSLVYSMHLDRVPNDDSKEIDLLYDFPSICAGTGKFQKLYIDKGNTLPIYYRQVEGTGIITTEKFHEGLHRFRIACFDFANNETEIVGNVFIAHKPIMQIASVDDYNVNLEGSLLASISKCTIYGKRLSESRWSQHTLPRGRFALTASGLQLPVNSGKYDVLKILGQTETGIVTSPVFFFKNKPRGSHAEPILTIEPQTNYTRVALTTRGVFTDRPSVIVKEGVSLRSIDLEPVDLNKYVGVFYPSDKYEGMREISATVEVNGYKEQTSKSFELLAIPPDKDGSISIHYGEMLISYDSGAVYRPLYLRMSQQSYNGTPAYELEPQNVLLHEGITVSLPKPSNSRHQHLGLYFRSNHGWVFQTDVQDSNRAYYSTTLKRTLGEVAVFGDDQQPTIGRLRVSARKSAVLVSFRYHDNLSGVDPAEIKLYIDGKLAIPELDGEHSRATYVSDSPLERGKHTLTIALKDRAKNEFTTERIFKIR
jgi:hypothetical protein